MNQVEVTILNTMADADFRSALDRQVEWGIRSLDLKDSIFGHAVAGLPLAEARRAARMIEERELSVHCLSTTLFEDDVEIGREEFVTRNLVPLAHALDVADILQPRMVRLIAAGSERRRELRDSVEYVGNRYSWLFGAYQEAIERIRDGGFLATIENESGSCLLASPAEVTDFFAGLGFGKAVTFTWDAVNMWKAGTYPSVEVYDHLKHLIGYFHVKGGRSDGDPMVLRWKSSLADAGWPLREITRRVVADAVSPVICINPPKGAKVEGYDPRQHFSDDIFYLKRTIEEEKPK